MTEMLRTTCSKAYALITYVEVSLLVGDMVTRFPSSQWLDFDSSSSLQGKEVHS